MSLGSRLRKERERLNLSQIYVAKKIGITNAVLSNYERDYRDPDTETLKKLADLYEVTTDYLLGRVDDPHAYATKEAFIEAAKEKGLDFSGMTQEEIDMFVRLIKDYRKNKGLD